MSSIEVGSYGAEENERNWSLFDILSGLWRRKFLILVITLLGMGSAFAYSKYTVPLYRARMLLIEVSDGSLLGVPVADLPGLGGLSALAAGAGISRNFRLFSAALTTQRLAGILERDHHFSQYIFKGKSAAEETPPSDGAGRQESVVSRVAAYLAANCSAEPQKATGVLEVTLTGRSPDDTVTMLSIIYAEVDKLVRADAKERLDERLAYLRDRFNTESALNARAQYNDIINRQSLQEVLLDTPIAYSTILFDPPVASVNPYWPNTRLIVTLGFIFGFMAGCSVALVLNLRGRQFPGRP